MVWGCAAATSTAWALDAWTQTNGPPGGTFTAFAVDSSTTPSTLYVGTDGGGVFKSTNGGAQWSAVNTGLTSRYVYTLAIDSGTLYAGTDGGGVFKSVNGGTQWNAVNTGLTSRYVRALTIDSGTLYAGTGGGVFKSTNGGTQWNAVNTGLTNSQVFSLAIGSGTLYAGTSGGVFKSTNGGAQWNAVNTGLTSSYVYTLAIDSGTLYAGTNGGSVFKSTNGGTQWTAANTGLTNGQVLSLAIDSGKLYAGTNGSGVFKSTNGAVSSNSQLSNLTVSIGSGAATLSPSFSATALTYSATVQSASATVTPTAWINDSVLTVNGNAATSGVGVPVALNPGVNSILVQLVSGDETTTTTYTVNITRQVIAPDMPTNVQAVAGMAGSGQVSVSWTPPTSGGTSALTGFIVNGNPSGGCTAAVGTNSCTVSGLNFGTSHSFMVTATNADGASTTSVVSNAVVPQNTQAITFPAQGSPNYSVNGTYSINPLASASSGLGVTYSSSSPTICGVSGTSMNMVSAGACIVAANQGGNVAYVAASQVTQTVIIQRGNNTITFPPQGSQPYTQSGSFALSPVATGESSQPVTYSSTTPSVCTISGTLVTKQAVGTCTIAANQAADNNWSAAPQTTQSISITAGTNTITFPAQGGQTYFTGGSFTVNPVATASSGLAVTYGSSTPTVCSVSGTNVQMISAGTCTITANQAGDATWGPATPVPQNVTIAKGANTITFPAQAAQTFAANGSFAINPLATATSGLTVTYTSTTASICTVAGTTVIMVAAGTCTIAADQAGNGNWVAATQVLQNVQVGQRTNTITFPAQANQTFVANGTFAINPLATASSNLPITYSSLTGSVCTVASTTVTMVAAGTCNLAADQAGDSNWDAAVQVTRALSITGVTPGAPTNVQATPAGPGQVTVTWTAPANTGGGITSYLVTAQPGGQTCTPTPATATTCTMTGLTNGQTYTFAVEAMNGAGSSSSGGNPPATSNPATPLVNPQAFTGTVPAGAGGNAGAAVGVTVSGGGNTCVFEHITVLSVSSASTAPPSHLNFPNGLLDFALNGCDASDVQVTLTLPSPLPQGGRYWKLSHDVWAPYANAVTQAGSTTVTLSLRDGGPGDDDGQVNGRIVDPGQVAVATNPADTSGTTAVPTLSPASIAMLALGLAWFGWKRKSRR
ncbi:IPTL-CTERM sorting domain-containing protein [Diaphorobacter sp. HDW4B]|uniref:IPTL-CTERM sorting domain-containing protein n=1 Tax=Diaphorobacter sp. HDW4B TaxID=2714925 RepID=UPI00197AEEDB|nr:IPTL-CTERM sorting domain-containing protein [Diaphorobacter sp. HDW4B]